MQVIDLERVINPDIALELFRERTKLWERSRDLHLRFFTCSEDDLSDIVDEFALFYHDLVNHKMASDALREARRTRQ